MMIELFIFYASNEENVLLAEAFDEYRDNDRNSQSVFLFVVTLFRNGIPVESFPHIS